MSQSRYNRWPGVHSSPTRYPTLWTLTQSSSFEAAQDTPYLWDFPPPAVVRISGQARGVIRAAGRGWWADPVGRRHAGIFGPPYVQELEAPPLRGLPEEAWPGGELTGQRGKRSGKKKQNNLLPSCSILSPNTHNLTLMGVSGAGEEEKDETHLLPKQLLSSSMSS